jgi:hypothetical protein
MKNKMLLTLALGLAGATSLLATTVDVYITGSTAFRANVYTACTKLYTGGTPTAIYFGDATHGGANSGFSSGTAAWVMTGTPVSTLTNLAGVTLNVHGLFTGSIQGIQTVEQITKLTFPNVGGVNTNGGLCGAYATNSPTIGFSDASGSASPYTALGNYLEENVCVLPFIMVKSVGSGFAANVMTNLNNVSWEQLESAIPAGRLPLSAWTYNGADTNTWVYLLQRTLDSGTRRCETAQEYYQYGDPVGTYIYDTTANNFFYPTQSVLTASSAGLAPNGVVGAAGLNSVNLNWGYGYVGGGDIKNALNSAGTSNTSLSYLSFSDGKGVGASNWANVVTFNGIWPTAAGAGLRGNTGTNDFSPITSGFYPCWGLEVLVHPIDPSLVGDQNITKNQLGNQSKPGSFLGVFNAQTFINGGSPIVGSIENEIELSKTGGATAIRLSDMKSNRSAVGGTISPF